MVSRPKSDRQWRGPGVALAAILALAAGLRVPGLEYGLPFGNLLNPDEQSIVPRAWRMVHGGGLDPGWFDYPTAVMYLLAPWQAWHSVPSYLTARVVILLFGVAAVAAAWWLGRHAYGVGAAVVAAAAVAVDATHIAYSRMAVTDIPLTLFVAAALALMISGRLEWSGVAVGLAAGAKYPGVFLLAPLLVAGWGRWRRVAVAAGLAAAVFLATNPFVAVHPAAAADDALRVQRRARDGWLGFEHDHWTPIAFLDRLWEGLGPTLVVAGAGLVLALVRRTRSDLVLASFTLVYFASLVPLEAHFDRYVLPLVPVLGALAGRLRPLAPVALALLVVPLVWSLEDDVRLTRTDTRVVAHRWIETALPNGARVAVDPSIAPLDDVSVLPLALPGPAFRSDPNRDVSRLRAAGVEYAVVTGAIADRVLAARDRYLREARFYDRLRTSTKRLYYVSSGRGLTGPWVAVYRL